MKQFGSIRLFRDDVSTLHKIFYRIAGVCPDHLLRFKYMDKLMRRFVRQQNLASVLDAGCGPGDYSFYLAANFPECKVLGIDIADDRISNNCGLLEKTHLKNLKFERHDLLQLDTKDSFDFICCVDCLEHIEQQQEALVKLHGALKQGGRLYVHLPLKRQRPVIFDKHLKDFHDWVKHEHTAIQHTRESFIELVENNGFEVLATENTFNHYLGEFAVSITNLFRRNTLINRLILCLLMPFMCLLVYLDYWIENKNGNALALMLGKR